MLKDKVGKVAGIAEDQPINKHLLPAMFVDYVTHLGILLMIVHNELLHHQIMSVMAVVKVVIGNGTVH